MNNTRLTKEVKMLAIVGVLPLLRDFLEDLQEMKMFRQQLKKAVNDTIKETDAMLFMVSQGIEGDAAQQQNDIEMWFRQQLIENFN